MVLGVFSFSAKGNKGWAVSNVYSWGHDGSWTNSGLQD